MRVLLDAQLPPSLIGWFGERDIEAVHVATVLGGQTPDRLIATLAERSGCALFTKDDDFALRFPPVAYQLVWVRCGNISNRSLRDWLDARWRVLEARLAAGDRLIEVR